MESVDISLMLDSYINGTVQSVVGGLLLILIIFVYKRINKKVNVRFSNEHLSLELLSYLFLFLASAVFYLNYSNSLSDKSAFIIITLFIFVSLFIKVIHFGKLRKLGIIAFDREMQTGITVDKALDMVNRNLDFIGVGADKLLKSERFEPAVRRCIKNGGKIQLILCDPNSPALLEMAKVAEVEDVEEFKEKVEASHRLIRKMITEKGWPISLFIYQAESVKKLPVFRLLVIDKKTYVSSYSVYGLGDKASQLPQMICYKSGQDEDDYKTFSYAFENFKRFMIESSKFINFDL